jgi:uncharacterized OB-fold protein
VTAEWPEEAFVYTETVVYTPPERYAGDAPYQLAILQGGDGVRFTARIAADSESARVRIGDKARFLREHEGVPFYTRVPQ